MRQTFYIDPRHFEHETLSAIARGVQGGLNRAGARIASDARQLAPVDTTSLRSSIMSQEDRGRTGLDTVVTVGPNVKSKDGAPYDVFQEFGTGLYSESPRSGWSKVESVDGDVVGMKFKGRGVIRPRKKKYLSFKPKGSGTLIHCKFVRGVRPTRYMRTALSQLNFEAEFVKGFGATK